MLRGPWSWRCGKLCVAANTLRLGHNYIGTEHLLLGVIREGEGVAVEILVELGAVLSTVRDRVIELLVGYDSWSVVGDSGPGPMGRPLPTADPARMWRRSAGVRSRAGSVLSGSVLMFSGDVNLGRGDGRLTGVVGDVEVDVAG